MRDEVASITSMSPWLRTLRIGLPALAIGLLAATLAVYFTRGLVPGDAIVYLAAGERLDAGHLLYALSPGDRVVGIQPPYWLVPLLSPPPIAVLFRALAVLPGESGAYVWWVACLAVIAASMAALLRRRPITTAVAILVLTVPIVYEVGVGNLNAFVLGGLLAVWYLITRGRDTSAGAIVAVLTAFKLTPIVFVWWLFTQRRMRAIRAWLATGVVVLVVSLLGAGIGPHLDYLGIVTHTSAAGTSDLSLAGMARFIGVDPGLARLLPIVALVIGAVCIWATRRRPGLAFSLTVVTMLAASPVVNINWFAILLVALAPSAWPMAATAEPTPLPVPTASTTEPATGVA